MLIISAGIDSHPSLLITLHQLPPPPPAPFKTRKPVVNKLLLFKMLDLKYWGRIVRESNDAVATHALAHTHAHAEQ